MHKPEAPSRELTKTEIDIAVAQIVDRLTRLTLCVEEIQSAAEQDGSTLDYHDRESYRPFMEKRGIPPGVHPMWHEAITVEKAAKLKPLIRRWVSGKLTKSECEGMCFQAQEWDEYDFAWVFLDVPSWNYDDSGGSYEQLKQTTAQFLSIGTRKWGGKKHPAGEWMSLPKTVLDELGTIT